jgi:hypothetical protein
LIVTPACVPQDSTSFVQSDEAFYCGYGSQKVYVPPPDEPDDDGAAELPPLEQPASAAAMVPMARSEAPAARALRDTVTVIPL